MKKTSYLWTLTAILVWSLSITFTSCSIDDNIVVIHESAPLKEVLLNTGHFTMISENPDSNLMKQKEQGKIVYKEQYSMFFLQDLNHDDEGGDSFQQKVCILFRGFDRPTVFVTLGYDYDGFRDALDLGTNLDANMVYVEHRNYGESYNQDNGKWEYQTLAQASADLHAIYQVLKPLFPGKWLSAGTSKDGETSISYAYYYPQDMDLAVGFCAPFVIGLNDERFGEYLYNEIGTEEERKLMKAGIRKALQYGEDGFYQVACQEMEAAGMKAPEFTEYVYNVFDAYYNMYQYNLASEGRAALIEQMATDDEMLMMEICAMIEENRDAAYRAYWVECAKEMGWQDNGYKYYSDLLEGTSFNPDDALPQILNEEDRNIVQSYDSSVFTDIVHNFFMTSTCPLLLYYSHDDPWTAGMPQQVGPNVKIVVNPIGIHCPYLNDPVYCPETTKLEVMNYVQTYIY